MSEEVPPPSAASPIEFRELHHCFPEGTEALRGITLRVERGEVFGLLGPNGAGKTTLIRHLTGELAPTRGEARLFGEDVRRDPFTARQRLGVCPQAGGLFDNLSVLAHLRHFSALQGLYAPRATAEVERVVSLWRLEEILDKRAGALSGGQRRKVIVALATLGDPEVVVLDEPTVGLDPVSRREIWTSIEGMARAGKTILLTSHYLDEVERLSRRIGFIQSGRLTHLGTLQELCSLLGWSVCVRHYAEKKASRRSITSTTWPRPRTSPAIRASSATPSPRPTSKRSTSA